MSTSAPPSFEEVLSSNLQDVPFLVFDTETSLASFAGRAAHYDLVEIGCIATTLEAHDSQTFQSLVRPHYPFNRASCVAMHITEPALLVAPFFPEIAGSVTELFEGHVLVGHNTPFDIRTVSQAIELYSSLHRLDARLRDRLLGALHQPYLDTKKIYTALFPASRQSSLDSASRQLGVNPEGLRHSALDDARLTLKVFEKLVSLAESRHIVTLEALLRLQDGKLNAAEQLSFF